MKIAARLYTFLLYVFLYMPIVVFIIYSFNSSNSTRTLAGFSFHWYVELFRDEATVDAVKNTLILAVTSSIIATVIGTMAAVGIDKMKMGVFKTSLLTVTNIPMMNPEIVTGVSMMLLFVFITKIINITGILSFWTILIAHVTFNLPYVILSVLPKLKQIDPHLNEAAQDLGCTPIQSFFHAVFPMITPGIFTGFIMSFTLSLDDFVISYFTSGPEFQTLPIRIFAMTKKRVTPDMFALSSIMFFVILLLLILINVVQARDEKINKNKKIKHKK